MDRKDLSLERQLVLMASIEVKEERCEEFKEIINNRLDWADVLFQMITHRTINMFCYNLKKFKLFDTLEKEVQRLLQSQWQVYSERNNFYLNELALLLQELEKYNIVVPVLKGNLLASIVYPAIETRIFNDLDLIIRLDDIIPVTKALEKLGYVQGHYDEERNEIIEATRQEKILQQMTSHELQEFQKLSSNKFAGLVQVDVNHDILWKGNCPSICGDIDQESLADIGFDSISYGQMIVAIEKCFGFEMEDEFLDYNGFPTFGDFISYLGKRFKELSECQNIN